MRKQFLISAVLMIIILTAVTVIAFIFEAQWLEIMAIVFWLLFAPLLIIGFDDYFQKKHTIKRNFPLIGRGRYLFEKIRPAIYQYFIESDIDGRPFSRVERSVVYQRAKDVLDTAPFGTQLEVYEEGYEWMNHSISPKDAHHLNHHPKVMVGGPDCKQPYECSILNISAMSYGSLSKNAILALNEGAKIGRFAHNTGEGGVSPYHLRPGGDLIYQVGTGYFGARNVDGTFSPKTFAQTASADSVKMIEIKLSQGAKPGHGGILPAKKNTPEIAKIRGVKPGEAVHSPPFHSAFSTPIEMLEFIAQVRELADGKPVGFKLCVGKASEFVAICKAMVKTGIKPDFIAVDGGEGGTGAAPIEFSNSVGMPMRDGLAFVYNALVGFDLKKDIRIIASGKIATGFHMMRAMALGADICYSARAMMLSLGCIQSLECNRNICPTGIATQKAHLIAGLDPKLKAARVAEYHKETVLSFVELMAAAGLENPESVNRTHINRNETPTIIKRYDECYPYIKAGSLLVGGEIPESFKAAMAESTPDSFQPNYNFEGIGR